MTSVRFRKLVRKALPPIIVDAMRRLQKAEEREEPEWEYAPLGWATKSLRIEGWNDESAAEVQKALFLKLLERTKTTQPLHSSYDAHHLLMCYAYVLALTARRKEKISLLDWGGGVGYYYLLSKVLVPNLEIEYYNYDLPRIREVGRQLLPEGTFYEDFEECLKRKYDLVLASNSLKYFENWRNIVRRLSSATHAYLYVTLDMVINTASFVTLQRLRGMGYKTEFLSWFLNRQEFLDCVSQAGMDLVREFPIQGTLVSNAPEQGEHRGFLFRTR